MPLKKVALLDRERRVYLRMVEVDEALIDPAIHLPQITQCDLPADAYRWVEQPLDHNPLGGRFEPLPRHQRAVAGAPTIEQAFAFEMLNQHALDPQGCADVTLRWLDAVVFSVDLAGFADAPLVRDYIAARGLSAPARSTGGEA